MMFYSVISNSVYLKFSYFTSRKAKRNRILSCTLCCTISKEKKRTTLTLGMIQGHTGLICGWLILLRFRFTSNGPPTANTMRAFLLLSEVQNVRNQEPYVVIKTCFLSITRHWPHQMASLSLVQ